MEKIHMLHPASGGALCGAARTPNTTTDADAVTCPLCTVLDEARVAAHRLVDGVQTRVVEKLAELQRDPGVRVLTRFARSVLAADRANKADPS